MSTEPLTDVINAGSSSLKFNIYQGKQRILVGRVDRFGVDPSASAIGPNGETITPPDLSTKSPAAPSEALPAILQWARGRRLEALGHRIVHGGLQHSRPARVTPELLTELEALMPIAPLHEPRNLAPIKNGDAAAMGGLDGTAGVGENAAPVCGAICRACKWLGLELDETANQRHGPRVSTPGSRVAAYVIKADENLMIARHAGAMVA